MVSVRSNDLRFITNVSKGRNHVAAVGSQIQRLKEKEEVMMTPYTPEELQQDWEFKILRAQLGEFGNSEKRQDILNEEARAGWQLVEIFDWSRMRLKRPKSAKEHDRELDFDPYRTIAPLRPTALVASVLVILAGVAILSFVFMILKFISM